MERTELLENFIERSKIIAEKLKLNLLLDLEEFTHTLDGKKLVISATSDKVYEANRHGGYYGGDGSKDVLVVYEYGGQYKLSIVQTCYNCGDGHTTDLTNLI